MTVKNKKGLKALNYFLIKIKIKKVFIKMKGRILPEKELYL